MGTSRRTMEIHRRPDRAGRLAFRLAQRSTREVKLVGFANSAGVTQHNCVPYTSYGQTTGKTGKNGYTGMGKSGKNGKGSYNAQTSLPGMSETIRFNGRKEWENNFSG